MRGRRHQMPWREYIGTRTSAIDGMLDHPFLAEEHHHSLTTEKNSLRLLLRAARYAAGFPPPDPDPASEGENPEPGPNNRGLQGPWLISLEKDPRAFPGGVVREFFTGARKDAAFQYLHAAEVALTALLPSHQVNARFPDGVSKLRKAVKDATDPRLQLVEHEYSHFLRRATKGPVDPAESATNAEDTNRRRAVLSRALDTAYDIGDQHHARVRSFRNVVLATAAVVTVVTVSLGVVGGLSPGALPLCFNASAPSGTAQNGQVPTIEPACPTREGIGVQPSGGDVAIVAMLGLVGGALTAAVSLRQARGSATPYSLPVALGLLKLPLGALTSIVVLMLVRGDFIPGLSQLDNQGQILAYALVFGMAQQAFTRLVDRQARLVLDAVPAKHASGDEGTVRQRPPGTAQTARQPDVDLTTADA